ncbi:MAG: hypothetical protein JXL80_05040 [Planctomycetes bacterium]|nr:hypothetical protein [Planctomycetota bacterium]
MRVREHVSGLIIVLLVTLVVWVVADRSVLRTSREMTVTVNVSVLDKTRYRASVVEPADQQMKVRFQGPGRAIDQLESRRQPLAFQYTLSDAECQEATQTGSLVVLAREGFRNQDLSREHITLETAAPQKVTVRVEQVRQKKVPVVLPPDLADMLADDWTATPGEVIAELPGTVWSELEKSGVQLVAYLQINTNTEAVLDRQEITQTVNLTPSIPDPEMRIRFVPQQVEVTFRLTRPLAKEKLDPIPILVAGPLDKLSKYDVVLLESPDVTLIDAREAVLKNLRVTGPASEISSLGPDDVQVFLILKESDKANTTTPIIRSPEIFFRSGLHLRLDEDFPRPSVNFNLVERNKAGEPPSP